MMWEKVMGLLSDLFGAGKRRDEAQDARIAALEARPAGDAETIAAMQAALAGLAGRIDAIEGAETIDGVARAAVAGSAAAIQSIHDRVAIIEAEFASLPTVDGGITVPEIEP